jgi:hypothetical protein
MWPCLLSNRNEISNLYITPSTDASDKIQFIWLSGFREDFFLENQPIRNKNCIWQSCLLMDWNEINNLNRGPSNDASYQVSVHFAKQYKSRRFLEIHQPETRIAYGGNVC